MRDDKIQILEAGGNLIDTNHFFGTVKVEASQGIAHQKAGFMFFIKSHRIFQVEDEAVGVMQPGVDHQAGRIARQIKPRETVAVFGGFVAVGFEVFGKKRLFARHKFFYSSFEPCSHDEWQGTTVFHHYMCIFDLKKIEHLMDAPHDVGAKHKFYFAGKLNIDASCVGKPDGNMTIRTYSFAFISGSSGILQFSPPCLFLFLLIKK